MIVVEAYKSKVDREYKINPISSEEVGTVRGLEYIMDKLLQYQTGLHISLFVKETGRSVSLSEAMNGGFLKSRLNGA